MANLLEAYKNRLAIAEKVYSRTHAGEALSQSKKIATAKMLANTNAFLNESFNNSIGTQRSDLGLFKKFCLNLTSVAVPSLIAYDLVIVHPLASMSGYVTYIQYTAGSNKGQTAQGKVLNSPFKLGDVDVNYTSAKVISETKVAGTTATAYAAKLNWAPVVKGTVDIVVGTAEYKDGGDGKLYLVTSGEITSTQVGTVAYADGAITLTADYAPATAPVANYAYDNVVIPQNDIAILNAELRDIPVVAKPRRIAVYYSQIAAFQAKTDYGFDLGDQLAEQAVGELAYEIDTEVCGLLVDNADAEVELSWNKRIPIGVSMSQHYESFAEKIEAGKKIIYKRTKKFAPNYMLVAADVLQVLAFLKGWTAAPAQAMNGPYMAGTINGIKVFVTPNIADGTYVLGVNGNDLMSSAAVYAPYMAIVPTQLLGYADGGMSQGFSTLYALEMLNNLLLVKGSIVDAARTDAFGPVSVASSAAAPIYTNVASSAVAPIYTLDVTPDVAGG